MPALPSLRPLTRTIAAGSPQKTVFYNNTRPQSKTDNVNGFMVRYTVQLMFSCKPAPLHCLSSLSPPPPGVSRPLSTSCFSFFFFCFPPLLSPPSVLLGSPSLSLAPYEKSIPAWVLTACLWWVCKIQIIHCA